MRIREKEGLYHHIQHTLQQQIQHHQIPDESRYEAGYLQNTLAILITDGYDFYLFDDIFKETEYLLPRKFKSDNNKKPTLKVGFSYP